MSLTIVVPDDPGLPAVLTVGAYELAASVRQEADDRHLRVRVLVRGPVGEVSDTLLWEVATDRRLAADLAPRLVEVIVGTMEFAGIRAAQLCPGSITGALIRDASPSAAGRYLVRALAWAALASLHLGKGAHAMPRIAGEVRVNWASGGLDLPASREGGARVDG